MRSMSGVIALGAVIKGETSHDQHINRAVSSALMQLSMDHNKPIAFGLLTVNSLEQAIHRSGGNKGNKGEECAQALLSCLRLGVAMDDLSEDVSY
jgi:6,7-dimethyl-8-ribityllumazine synthase